MCLRELSMNIDFNLKIFSFQRRISIGKEWTRSGFIAIVLLMSTVVAYWGSSRVLILLLAGMFGLVGVFILLKQPNLSFLLILLGGVFVPFVGPGGVNAAALSVALAISIWLSNMLVVQRRFQFNKSRVLLPVIVFLTLSVIAFGMGQLPWFAFANQAPLNAQAGGFAIFVLSLLGLVAAAHLLVNNKWLEIIVWIFIGLGAAYIFGRLVGIPIGRLYNWAFLAGSMFWTWLVTLAFAQAFFNTKLKISARVLLYAVVLSTMFVSYVWGNDWKSGWVPPLVAIAVMVALKYKRLVILAVPFALMAVVYLAFRLISNDAYSWGTRVDAWRIVFEISKVSPLFGLGFANYYWYTPLFPIRGYAVSFNSHSQFVDLIAQVGILGLLSFLWLFFEVGRLGWNLSHSNLADGFAKAYARGVFAGVFATLMGAFLGDWVLPFVYNIGFSGFRASILPWIFFGGLLAIEQMAREKARL